MFQKTCKIKDATGGAASFAAWWIDLWNISKHEHVQSTKKRVIKTEERFFCLPSRCVYVLLWWSRYNNINNYFIWI